MKSILFVDDEPHVSRVAKLSLERAGYRVELAHNGEEALPRVLEGSFDAVITDIQMPKMGGREFCEQIQARIPNRKFFIFVVTARSEDAYRTWASGLDSCELIEKPLSMRYLLSRLAHHLGGPD